jgi:hypothetical protein
VITSFLSPGDVYCSRSVCYLPQGLSVECLNLQAPTFLGRIFKSPPTSLLYGPEIRRVSRGPSEVLQRRPKTPSPDYAQVLVTKRRKRRPECVGPRARGTRLRVGPRKRTVRYVKEADRGGTRFAGRAGGAQRTPDDFVAAVENLCMIRAKNSFPH